MLTSLRTRALGAFVAVQTSATGGLAPRTRADKAQMLVGAAIAWLLAVLSIEATDAHAEKATGSQAKVVALIDKFTNFIVLIVAALSVLMGVWAALQFVGSGGNSQVASKAKSTIKNVVIGLVVCAGIFIIKNAVLAVVGGAGGDGNSTKFNQDLQDNGAL